MSVMPAEVTRQPKLPPFHTCIAGKQLEGIYPSPRPTKAGDPPVT